MNFGSAEAVPDSIIANKLSVCGGKHRERAAFSTAAHVVKRRVANSSSDVKFGIGHVLFIDIVGYSKLLINEQTEQLEKLWRTVRATEQVAIAESKEELLRLPAGDGGALVFGSSPEAPVACAVEIAKALKHEPQLRVRMGVHSGPVNKVADLNEQANLAGAGVDIAQRVMSCGDAGHILLSKRVADDLSPYPKWNRYLHDLGQCEVKHGEKVGLVNFFTEDVGNPELPHKCRRPDLAPIADSKTTQPARAVFGRVLAGVAALLIVGIVIGSLMLWRQQPVRSSGSSGSISAPTAKSIAVLPFENLSEDKSNAYFADGVQDEILTNLAKIADLKVISRSSVMQYRTGIERNMREIGRQLGVAHLLEGSVQRAGAKIRVNAQLIDSRTDAHVWAQTYDRDLADVFAIQSEIASDIAKQLQATLAPEEKSRIATKPTENSEAYLLYLQANDAVRTAASKDDAVRADNLYAAAISADPLFVLAVARASVLNSLMYFIGRDPARKERARVLASRALSLAPNLGEAHVAQGLCFYRIDADYDKALKELAVASTTLPNNSEILDVTGFIYRRQGRWRDALTLFKRAAELDPRRAHFDGLPATLRALRQWPDAKAAFEHALSLETQAVDGWVGLAYVEFAQTGDPAAALKLLDHLPEALRQKPDASQARWEYAMMARDFAAAEASAPNRPTEEFPAFEPLAFYQACIAHARGDEKGANTAADQLLSLHEAGARNHPDEPDFHTRLAKLYVLLGNKEAAIREGRRAVDLRPASKDAITAAESEANLAFVYAQTGEVEPAVDLLSRLLTTPGTSQITLAHLRASWEWDPLRKNPRFQKILESPEPKTIYN